MSKKKSLPRVSKEFKKRYPVLNSAIVAAAVITFWRGVWGLLDMYLLPGYPFLSHVVSILIGLFILLIDDFRLDELH